MMGAVTPETCRVTLQQINICILLHLVEFLLTLIFKEVTVDFSAVFEVLKEFATLGKKPESLPTSQNHIIGSRS